MVRQVTAQGSTCCQGPMIHAGSQAQQLRGQHADWTESGSSSMQPEGSQPRLDYTILFLGSKAQIFPSIGADSAAMLAADMGNPTPKPLRRQSSSCSCRRIADIRWPEQLRPAAGCNRFAIAGADALGAGAWQPPTPHQARDWACLGRGAEQAHGPGHPFAWAHNSTGRLLFAMHMQQWAGYASHACMPEQAGIGQCGRNIPIILPLCLCKQIFATTFPAKCRSWQFSCPQCLSGAHEQAHICEHAELVTMQEVSPSELSLPSNSLATDLQKGQFFPTKGQPTPMSISQELESTGDIVDDVHALEEHAKAVASTAEVSLNASCGGASLHDGWPLFHEAALQRLRR